MEKKSEGCFQHELTKSLKLRMLDLRSCYCLF